VERLMNLNAVNIGMNKYCGPAVLSILTGKSTDECARVISSINGQYRVEGVLLSHLLRAADRLGFDNQAIQPGATLFGTLTRLANNEGMYIVSLSDHFAAVEVKDRKIYFCDNHTKMPMPAASSARMMQKCLAVNKVFKRPEVVIPPPPPPKVEEPKVCEINPKQSQIFRLEFYTAHAMPKQAWEELVMSKLLDLEQLWNEKGDIRVHIHEVDE
jgi:hypothetical protein